MTKSQARVGMLGKATRAMGAAVAAGFAVGAYAAVSFTRKLIDAGDEIGKMSKRTGVAIGDIQKLSFAAERSGAQMADVEKAFKRMSSTIFDAGQGLAESERALNALGLTFEALDGKRPERQFALIAERLDQVADASKKSALAQDLFGRSGTALIPMLGEYKQLAKEITDLGGIISDEDVKAAESFKDEMTNLGVVIRNSVVKSGVLKWLDNVATGIGEVMQARNALAASGTSDDGGFVKETAKIIDWFNKNTTPQGLINKAIEANQGGPRDMFGAASVEEKAADAKRVADKRVEVEGLAAAKIAAANSSRITKMIADEDKAAEARQSIRDTLQAKRRQALDEQIAQEKKIADEKREQLRLEEESLALQLRAFNRQQRVEDLVNLFNPKNLDRAERLMFPEAAVRGSAAAFKAETQNPLINQAAANREAKRQRDEANRKLAQILVAIGTGTGLLE